MGDPALADESKIIDYPYFDQTAEWPSKRGVMEFEANYMMMIDNLMDLTHLGYVHTKSIGGDPAVHFNADMTVTPTDVGVTLERWMLDTKPPPTYVEAVGFKGQIDRWARFEYHAPGTVMQWSGAVDAGIGTKEIPDNDGLHFRVLHSVTPKTDRSLYYFFGPAINFRQDEPAALQELYDSTSVRLKIE